MDKVPMTAEGYATLSEAEIKRLAKTVERPRIIKLIAEARTHGDLQECRIPCRQGAAGHHRGAHGRPGQLGRAEDTRHLRSRRATWPCSAPR